MQSDDTDFVVLMTAHNASHYVGRSLLSVSKQERVSWRIVFVDDASTDGTAEAAQSAAASSCIEDRLTVVHNPERKFKARSVYEALRTHVQDGEVVVMLDGDDWLAAPQALAVLDAQYRDGWDVVWGDWVGSDGCQGTSYYLNPFLSVRQQPFVSSHLFSFRRALFDDVPAAEWQDDTGEWFKAGCDVAIAYSVLERTIRARFVDEILCVYNRENPLSHDKVEGGKGHLVSAGQAQTSRILVSRPPRVPPPDDAFVSRNICYYLTAMAHGTANRETVLRNAAGRALMSAFAKGTCSER